MTQASQDDERNHLQGLQRAEHGDPFAFLGPHPEGDGWRVRPRSWIASATTTRPQPPPFTRSAL